MRAIAALAALSLCGCFINWDVFVDGGLSDGGQPDGARRGDASLNDASTPVSYACGMPQLLVPTWDRTTSRIERFSYAGSTWTQCRSIVVPDVGTDRVMAVAGLAGSPQRLMVLLQTQALMLHVYDDHVESGASNTFSGQKSGDAFVFTGLPGSQFAVSLTNVTTSNVRELWFYDGDANRIAVRSATSSPSLPTALTSSAIAVTVDPEDHDQLIYLRQNTDNWLMRTSLEGPVDVAFSLSDTPLFDTIAGHSYDSGVVRFSMAVSGPSDVFQYIRNDVYGGGQSCGECVDIVGVVPHPGRDDRDMIVCHAPGEELFLTDSARCGVPLFRTRALGGRPSAVSAP